MRYSVKTLLLGTVLYSIDHNFKNKKERKNELVTKTTTKVLPEITITRLYTVKPETIELPVTSEPRRTFFFPIITSFLQRENPAPTQHFLLKCQKLEFFKQKKVRLVLLVAGGEEVGRVGGNGRGWGGKGVKYRKNGLMDLFNNYKCVFHSGVI